MDKTEEKTVPYIAFELIQAKNERTVKRLFTALLLTIVLLFASNVAWLYYWNQYEYVAEDYDYAQDGAGMNLINTGVLYGSEITDTHRTQEKEEEEGQHGEGADSEEETQINEY